ncbi:autotransporter outer membrane beta-barrel domain-containing protein [Candidatus Pelagibacter bacterium]|nr:autotransporter outer membrane beta-barrel domain-containing protein [Candidatus Pelagibacter bacterium]
MNTLKYRKYFLLISFILLLNYSISNATTVTFSYTGAQQSWTVPSGVTSITVDAYGAGGGDSSGNSGGNGARVQTTLTVTPGDILYIYVGETGWDAANGSTPSTSFNGGGKGGQSNIGTRSGGSGGGQTDIRTSTSTSDIIMVAAGGGGASAAGNGGSGGQTGSDGVGSSKGLGASQSSGGTKGTGNTGRDSSDGSAFTGGTGGRTANYLSQYGGGGGGAGYYGGGGGGAGTSGSASGSGGGGSSYVSSSLGSSTTFTTGYSSASGNGSLSIEYTVTNPTTDKDVIGSIDTQSQLAKSFIIQSTSTVSNRLSYLRQNKDNQNLSKQNIKLDFGNAILMSLTNELLAKNDKSIIPDNWSSWSDGSLSSSKIGDSTNSSSSETDAQALAFGFDTKLNDNDLLGFAIQYGKSDTDVGSSGSKTDSENINFSVYRTRPLDNDNFIEGMFGIGLIESDLSRISGSNTLTGSRNGTQIFGSINYGKTLDKGDFNLTPIARVDLGYTELDAYSESGTDALSYAKQTIESGLASVGLQFSDIVKFNDNKLKPFGSIEYGMDFSNSSDAKINYVSDTSTIYTYTQGANSNHLITSVVGFEYITINNLNIITSYKRIQGNESEQTDILNVSVNFKSKRETEYAMSIDGSEDLKAGFDITKNVNGFDLKFNANHSLSENSDQAANISLSRSF